MKTLYLITPLAQGFPVDRQADYIGIDAGFLPIQQAGLPLKAVLGDFDSLNGASIPENAIVHPVRKNETDSELAMQLAEEMGYDKVILWGGLSGRLDHTLANLRLIAWRFVNVVLEDETHRAFTLLPGRHVLEDPWPHLSLFAMEDSVISLHDVSYELDHAFVSKKDIYTVSNSFTDKPAVIDVHSGRLLCILSRAR